MTEVDQKMVATILVTICLLIGTVLDFFERRSTR